MCADCREEVGNGSSGHVLIQDSTAADPVLLLNMKDMGFAERDARLALERTGNRSLEAAMDFISTHVKGLALGEADVRTSRAHGAHHALVVGGDPAHVDGVAQREIPVRHQDLHVPVLQRAGHVAVAVDAPVHLRRAHRSSGAQR